MSVYKSQAGLYPDESDADDEYERGSVFMSPTLPPDGYASPTDSESPSTEHTPTSYTHPTHGAHGTHQRDGRDGVGYGASPRGLISDWSAEQSADFVSGLGLAQYGDKFVEEAITGDALVALLHSDLKEMGISSVGHRLTILKSVYDVKMKQNLPVEPDHYVPLSADADIEGAAPTQDDIARIIHIIKDRDAELRGLREELIRISEENRKLREDVLPIIKDRKNRSEPLPTPDELPEKSSSGLSRKFSTKRLFLSSNKPSSLSPTSIIQERNQQDNNLDPSAAAIAATNHLTASMRDDQGGRSPNAQQPSPTSPAYSTHAPSFSSNHPPSSSSTHAPSSSSAHAPSSGNSITRGQDRSDAYSTYSTNDKSTATTPSSQASSARENPQVEIFKSFRVSVEDPCHKVLPVALKKYNITADWRQYALYIVHGDQERCLGLNEKPLILFKQLDREGRKPMFMLRKHASPMEGISSTVGEGGAAAALAQRDAERAAQGNGKMQLPGGVL